jgi:O-Antigen ligase
MSTYTARLPRSFQAAMDALAHPRLRLWGGWAKKILIFLALLIPALLLGFMIGTFPPGFTVRVIALPIFIGFLILAWMMRSKRATMPGVLSMGVLLSTAALSVLWPRYVYFSVGGPQVNPLTLLTFASIVLALALIASSPALTARMAQVHRTSKPIGTILLLWLVWRFIATMSGKYPFAAGFDFVRELAYLTSFYLIGTIIACSADGPRILIRILLGCALLLGAAGLVEALLQRNPFVRFAGGGATLSAIDALKVVAAEKVRGGSYRTQATFEHPLVFAQFLVAALPLAGYAAFWERSKFWRLVAIVFIPIGLFTLYKTGSRAGVACLAGSLAFLGLFGWVKLVRSRGYGKAVAFAAVPAVFLGLAAVALLVEELASGRNRVEQSSSSVRLKMLELGVRALEDSPVLGFGQASAISKAGILDPVTGAGTLDSLLLSTAIDAGYVGLGLFLLFVLLVVGKGTLAALRLRGEESAHQICLVAAVLAVFGAFITLSINSNLTLFWLLCTATLPAMAASSPRPGRAAET